MSRVLPLLVLVACTREPTLPPTGAGAATGTPTGSAPATCDAPVDGLIELDPDGPDTQIHAASAAGAEGVWLAWNRPGTGGAFELYVARLGCDGQLTEAVRLDTGTASALEPSIAARGDQALVAWQADDGSGVDNLSIHWRLVDAGGSPLGDVRTAPATGNAWMPSAAATADGFVLAGAFAGATVFEAHALFLDPTGEPLGASAPLGGDPGGGQIWPVVAVDGADQAWFAFEQDGGVWWSDGAAAPSSVGAGATPAIDAAGDQIHLVWSDGADMLRATPAGAPVSLFAHGGGAFAPTVVAESGGGSVVAWLENQGGLANLVHVGRYDTAGSEVDEVALGQPDAPPYGMNLTPVADGVYFLAWQTGENPAYRSVGAFVRL